MTNATRGNARGDEATHLVRSSKASLRLNDASVTTSSVASLEKSVVHCTKVELWLPVVILWRLIEWIAAETTPSGSQVITSNVNLWLIEDSSLIATVQLWPSLKLIRRLESRVKKDSPSTKIQLSTIVHQENSLCEMMSHTKSKSPGTTAAESDRSIVAKKKNSWCILFIDTWFNNVCGNRDRWHVSEFYFYVRQIIY